MKKKPEQKEKVFCLYHEKDSENCPCIRPVTTQADLEKRIKNREVLARFGIKV